jgi:uncharacterized membrane protein (DUF485 family)
VSTTESQPPDSPEKSAEADWVAIQASPEFQNLRHRLRRFVFPVAALFLAWYLLFVLLATYAPSFMSIKLFGNINVGLVFGLLQFVSTFAITAAYVRYADRTLDPASTALRTEIEEGKA